MSDYVKVHPAAEQRILKEKALTDPEGCEADLMELWKNASREDVIANWIQEEMTQLVDDLVDKGLITVTETESGPYYAPTDQYNEVSDTPFRTFFLNTQMKRMFDQLEGTHEKKKQGDLLAGA